MEDDRNYRIILCGSSAYDRKYYFNHQFDELPESIREELQILCVLFTEEVGGVFTVGYTPTGEVIMDSHADEGDLLYDDIGSGLKMKQYQSRHSELFESLSIYYKAKYLHMDLSKLLDEEEQAL